MITNDPLSSLKQLGLTEYEAKAFWALTTMGTGNPREVAAAAEIPYPSAYDTLKSLASKGWVEIAASRPAIYTVRPPASIKKEVQTRIDKTFRQLEAVFRSAGEALPQLIYTIRGREKVLAKIHEMLDSARKFVFIVTPSSLLSDRSFKNWFQKLLAKRVLVNLVTDSISTPEVPEGYKVRFRDSVLAIDILIDGQQALIGLPDYSVCGWVESPIIAAHLQEFLELLWQQSHKTAVISRG